MLDQLSSPKQLFHIQRVIFKKRVIKELARREQEEAHVVKENCLLEHKRKKNKESVRSASMTREQMDLAMGYNTVERTLEAWSGTTKGMVYPWTKVCLEI